MNVDFAMTCVRDPKLRHWRRREQEGTRTTNNNNNNIYDAVYYCCCWASLRFKILVIRHPPNRIRKDKVWRCVHYDTEAVVVCNLPTSHRKFVSRKCFRLTFDTDDQYYYIILYRFSRVGSGYPFLYLASIK